MKKKEGGKERMEMKKVSTTCLVSEKDIHLLN